MERRQNEANPEQRRQEFLYFRLADVALWDCNFSIHSVNLPIPPPPVPPSPCTPCLSYVPHGTSYRDDRRILCNEIIFTFVIIAIVLAPTFLCNQLSQRLLTLCTSKENILVSLSLRTRSSIDRLREFLFVFTEIVTVLLVVYLKDVLSRQLQVRDAKGTISSFFPVEREARQEEQEPITMKNGRYLKKKREEKINLFLF